MCAPSPPPPPDYSGVAAANEEAARIAYQAANEDLSFRKQVYADSQPRQAQLYDLATRIANQQIGIADQNTTRANEQWGQHQAAYLPNEYQTIADAYGSSYLGDEDNAQMSDIISGKSGLDAGGSQLAMSRLGRKAEDIAAEQAMTRAGAEVNNAYGQAMRGMTRLGGDPNRMAFAAARLANNASLAKVGASNQARESVRGTQMGLRTGVANFGRNMPNTAGQAFGLATQAGNSAVGNQNQGFMSGLPYAQYASGGYAGQMGAAGLAQQGALGYGGLMNQGYGMQVNAWNGANASNAAGLGGLGQMAGMLGSAYIGSDRAIKENIELLDTRGDGIGIYSYDFRPEFKDRFGHGTYIGVMADEVEEVYPSAVIVGDDGIRRVNYSMLEV
jgi:hypothetical protein